MPSTRLTPVGIMDDWRLLLHGAQASGELKPSHLLRVEQVTSIFLGQLSLDSKINQERCTRSDDCDLSCREVSELAKNIASNATFFADTEFKNKTTIFFFFFFRLIFEKSTQRLSAGFP